MMIRYQSAAWLIALAVVVVGAALWLESQKQGPVHASSTPKSIATTFHGDPRTTRAFTWFTENPEDAAVIQWVKGSQFTGDNVQTLTGSTAVIQMEKKKSQAAHTVEITGLEPGTVYSYRVGSGQGTGWSEPSSFRTEPEGTNGFTFINVADSQGKTEKDFEQWGRTLDQAFKIFPHAGFIVHNGDLTEDPEEETGWDSFFGKTGSWLKQIPLMPVTGNHDEMNGNADRYLAHFQLPANGAKGSIPGTNYSFDYGSAHIVVLNTESNINGQTEWLRNDLARTDKPWKIVAMHRGVYGGNSYKKVEKWSELFDEFQVDLVLQGHNHEYSRSYPLRGGKITGNGDGPIVNHEGTVYVVTNASGTKFNEKKKDLFYHKVHFQNEKPMFAGITIEGSSLTYQAFDADGVKWDEFVIRHES
ncbi:metallophosphoesterase family protein [Paenibacillus sp. 32352]|uniref:purple acid phosphatase family protein n=1 Tax=Paenibacillus sp. 32352 TaxID=1969111 RepID=UPI002118AA35|nr:metallophosphoesterase family protein [Paenibacillus sp. 32352]